MRILLSASDFTNATNGLARSARDFCAGLRARGHEVRVISYGDSSHVDSRSSASAFLSLTATSAPRTSISLAPTAQFSRPL